MPGHNCLDRNRLTDFVLGKLAPEVIEAVGDHLDGCPRCRAQVAEMDDLSDALLDRVAASAHRAECGSDPGLPLALAMARAVGSSQQLSDQESPISADPRMPSQLGDYCLLGRIGEGGMGTVFRARHVEMDRIVALKFLPVARTGDAHAMARFRREIRASARLNHPNIVQAYDARELDGQRFLVMEYVDGVNLHQLVRQKGPLAVADASEIIRQTAICLQYAFQRGLIHRDIKPSNVMLARGGQVKLLDLGIALLERDRNVDGDGDVTGEGQMIGTLNFMAPEQACDGHDVDVHADIYGLGATLYKLLCGEAPFEGAEYATDAKKLAGLLTGSAVPVAERRDDVPLPLSQCVDKMLAKQPEDRFHTPEEVVEQLAPFAAGCDLQHLVEQAAPWPDPTGSTAGPLVTTGRDSRRPKRSKKPTGLAAITKPPRSPRIGLLLAAGLLAVFAGVTLVIRYGDKIFGVTVPDGSEVTAQLDSSGKLLVEVTTEGSSRQASAAAVPGVGAPHRPSPRGWPSARYDRFGSSSYPFRTTAQTSARLQRVPWTPDALPGSVSCIVTGDLTGDGNLEIVMRAGDAIVAYDHRGALLWQSNPVNDSQVEVPVLRAGDASGIELADFDGDMALEVVVLARSVENPQLIDKSPMRALVYDANGDILKNVKVIAGGVGPPQKCFDFDQDGFTDIAFISATHEHPHAACVFSFRTGRQLFRADFADFVAIAGVADLTGDGRDELYLVQEFDGDHDPPVDDYDSNHCYATMYDYTGKRLWKRTFEHALNGFLSDLDGDGIMEVMLLHESSQMGTLHQLDPRTGETLQKFPGINPEVFRCWSVADVQGDDRPEFVVGDGRQVLVIDAAMQLAARLPAEGVYVAATNDLNGDGHIEIIARRDADLLIYDGQLQALAQYHARGAIQKAIVSDIERDGINEVIMIVNDGDVAVPEVVRFAPKSQL